MNRLAFLTITLLTFGSFLTGCGSKGPVKEYPVGDMATPAREDLRERFEDREVVQERPRRRFIDVPANRSNLRGLQLVLTTTKNEYEVGDEMLFSVTLRNTTGIPETIPYTTEQRFDVVAFADEARTEPVFLWGETRTFAQTFREYTLSPNGSLNRILEIPTEEKPRGYVREMTDLSTPLGPGIYYVYALHNGLPFLAVGPVVVEVLP